MYISIYYILLSCATGDVRDAVTRFLLEVGLGAFRV